MATLIVTFGGVVVAAVAALAAIVQARAAHVSRIAAEDARNESSIARDEAVRLSQEANAAFVRQAEAQEEGNRLTKAALPRKAPKIELRRVADSKWMATNAGDLPAAAAQIIGVSGIIQPEDDEPRPLDIGDSLYFHVLKTLRSGPPRIRIRLEWSDEDGEKTTSESQITLP